MSEPSLKDRVLLYNLMQLPGQPQMMHVGSSNLVNDLAAEIARLTAALAEWKELTDIPAREQRAREEEREACELLVLRERDKASEDQDLDRLAASIRARSTP